MKEIIIYVIFSHFHYSFTEMIVFYHYCVMLFFMLLWFFRWLNRLCIYIAYPIAPVHSTRQIPLPDIALSAQREEGCLTRWEREETDWRSIH